MRVGTARRAGARRRARASRMLGRVVGSRIVTVRLFVVGRRGRLLGYNENLRLAKQSSFG